MGESCIANPRDTEGSPLKAIEFEDVTFSYGTEANAPVGDGDAVLDSCTFSMDTGEMVALVGDNGSGKTTIARICEGFVIPEAGTANVLGTDMRTATQSEVMALRERIGLVMQDPDDQFVASVVLDEVSFGPCNLGLPKEEVISHIAQALGAVGMADAADRNVNTLSGGERQRIAIADALAMEPDLLILDEPTSMLDDEGKEDLLATLRDLHADGMTILLITHDVNEASHADRILRVSDGKVSELDESSLEELLQEQTYTTKQMAYVEPADQGAVAANAEYDSVPIVRFDEVGFEYGTEDDPVSGILGFASEQKTVLDDFSLDIEEGQALSIMGPNGSGKSTVLRLMNGLLSPTSGTVTVDGISTVTKDGRNHARTVVGLCPQFPERGMFASTVRDEVALGPRNQHLPEDEVERRVMGSLASMGLDAERIAGISPSSLSGGMLRRIAIASVLAIEPRVLALDEPCAGLDAPSRCALLMKLRELADNGRTVVLVTHSESDAISLSDSILRLERPRA